MLFKLSLSNIRKSLRDYAIYFFTLIIGVSVFYVFNAIGGQAAMLEMSDSQYEMIQVLETLISGTSVFVAGVLGLLIVYASRFLMKRRNREFALYMTLGMSKRKISAILLLETLMIGVGSLFVGLLIGIGLSQLSSAIVANMFEADMTSYRFTVSGGAIVKTVVYFAVMYLVVMVFNSFVVTRMKLINLMQSGKKSEQIKLKNPVLCVVVFLLAAGLLGYLYYQVGWRSVRIDRNDAIAIFAAGSAATFLIFWSVSGMLLRVLMSMKSVYFKGLNSFTFRQLSSKINTMVFSMSVICLMLFMTICTLSAAFSIRNSMNKNLDELCPVDYELAINLDTDKQSAYSDIIEVCEDNGYDITSDFSDYVNFKTYNDPELLLADSLGDALNEALKQFRFLDYEAPEQLVRLSDYNALMELYGREKLSMADDEFIMLCNYTSMINLRNKGLSVGTERTVFGHTLRSKYGTCQDGFIDISTEHINAGLIVVPDNVIEVSAATTEYFIGEYSSKDKAAAEQEVHDSYDAVMRTVSMSGNQEDDVLGETNFQGYMWTTKLEIKEAAVGLGAIVAFLGLYVGLVFLIACGAILALKELSDSVDSIGRYETLRKIGAEESDISRSLLRQTWIFFLLPLVLAGIHSVFGMKFLIFFLQIFGTENVGSSVAMTALMILLIYGGYFLVTYFCSKGIIKGKR
ncbi:MAG: ABC transporter permease [Ruminococcus sp.]|nr:ABC transporter permease [Ruminococcus sp.]